MYQSFPQHFYTDSSSAMPSKLENAREYSPIPEKREIFEDNNKPAQKREGFLSGFLGNFLGDIKMEELLIIGLVILLLTEENDEWILIALLGFLLFF